jgi:hypothetical protein
MIAMGGEDAIAGRFPAASLALEGSRETASKGRITMHYLFVAALFALTVTSSGALAQVPPDIAEGIRKIGPIVDAPGTAKL